MKKIYFKPEIVLHSIEIANNLLGASDPKNRYYEIGSKELVGGSTTIGGGISTEEGSNEDIGSLSKGHSSWNWD